MQLKKIPPFAVTLIALLGVILPHPVWADAIGSRNSLARTAAGMPVVDVALHEGGLLKGQVIDVQGNPQADTSVALWRRGEHVGDAQTDAEGHFALAGLGSGVYQLKTAEGAGVCRLWAPGAAPPAAHEAVLLISGNEVVRGQRGMTAGRRQLLILGGAAAAAGVIGGVIGYNVRTPAS